MNLAINGFGRIGRTFLRNALKHQLNVLVINDLTEPKHYHIFLNMILFMVVLRGKFHIPQIA